MSTLTHRGPEFYQAGQELKTAKKAKAKRAADKLAYKIPVVRFVALPTSPGTPIVDRVLENTLVVRGLNDSDFNGPMEVASMRDFVGRQIEAYQASMDEIYTEERENEIALLEAEQKLESLKAERAELSMQRHNALNDMCAATSVFKLLDQRVTKNRLREDKRLAKKNAKQLK